VDPHHVRGDLALISRAIKEQWPIPDQVRASVIPIAVATAFDKDNSARDRMAALRVILMANAQNLKSAELALEVEKQRRGITDPAPSVNVTVNTQVQAILPMLRGATTAELEEMERTLQGIRDREAAAPLVVEHHPAGPGTNGDANGTHP
jgi:hypothetical protein